MPSCCAEFVQLRNVTYEARAVARKKSWRGRGRTMMARAPSRCGGIRARTALLNVTS